MKKNDPNQISFEDFLSGGLPKRTAENNKAKPDVGEFREAVKTETVIKEPVEKHKAKPTFEKPVKNSKAKPSLKKTAENSDAESVSAKPVITESSAKKRTRSSAKNTSPEKVVAPEEGAGVQRRCSEPSVSGTEEKASAAIEKKAEPVKKRTTKESSEKNAGASIKKTLVKKENRQDEPQKGKRGKGEKVADPPTPDDEGISIMTSFEVPKIIIPKDETLWVTFFRKGVPTHIITSKTLLRDQYFLYEVSEGGKIKKIDKAENPLDFDTALRL